LVDRLDGCGDELGGRRREDVASHRCIGHALADVRGVDRLMPGAATDHQAHLARLNFGTNQHAVCRAAQLAHGCRHITVENFADDVLGLVDDLLDLGHDAPCQWSRRCCRDHLS